MHNISSTNQVYRNNFTTTTIKHSTIKNQNLTTTSDIYSELKSHYPSLKINYASIKSGFNENSIKSFGFNNKHGSLYNLTIDPKIEKQMQSDPNYRKKILDQVDEQLGTPIPQLPGVKVASAGAIVSSDGSVTGYIIGEPDKESQEKERIWYIKRCKEKKEDQEKEKEDLINKQYENTLTEKATLQDISNSIGINNTNNYNHEYLVKNYRLY